MQDSNSKELGLYVHVPFCSTTCDFCAFYQERPSKKGFEQYFLALEKDFLAHLPEQKFSTVFIGGGTPGLLSALQIKELGKLIKQFGVLPRCEWTVEVAPNEISREKIEAFLEAGINRLSLGVQTLDPVFMKELGRDHNVSRALEAYKLVRNAGFKSVNLDLLFGAPGQQLCDWQDDLRKVVELDPDHLSTYCLTFEEDTALYAKLAKGAISIDPEREAEFYEWAWDYLPRQGFGQYEISNYAKPGMECRHNVNTWEMNDWIGYGPSASSQINRVRRKNFSNIEQWAQALLTEQPLHYEEWTELDNQELARDAILFGLRMNKGVKVNRIAERFAMDQSVFSGIINFLNALVTEGLAEQEGGNYRLTKEGRIRCDAIGSELPELRDQLVAI
jgi:oxygen-independent coproporphyrinogen-3 oxidase